MITQIVHWTALIIYICIFGYAGLQKVFYFSGMMEGMAALGFGAKWTFMIGLAEVIGAIGVIVGFFIQRIKIISVLLLFPIAIGAFTMHMGHHHPLSAYWQALTICILSIVILWTDETFRLVIK